MPDYPSEYTILGALVGVLDDLTGLKVYRYPVPGMEAPACVPFLEWEMNRTWGRLSGPITARILVLVPFSEEAPRIIGDYTDPDGSLSIADQLMTNQTLGGVVKGVRVTGLGRLETVSFPETVALLGRALEAQIWP